MIRLFDELKRRNVFRVGIAYVVAAWVVAQVADLVLENIGAPDWVIQTLLFLMAVGFFAALVIAWAYEVTPEGIKRERDVDRDQSMTPMTGRRLDIVTIGLVALAIGLLIVDRFLLDGPSTEPATSTAMPGDERGAAGNGNPGAGDSGGNVADAEEQSIAVLPFVNMSADTDQEYFADGVSEEILNALVKARGLRVAGRTSSFSFKGKDATIREIGAALNVGHVLEGSVRKQGNQVRVTAQLIKADDGFHLWSETYDKSLDDIFEVQDDIATEVTQALRVLLQLDDRERLAAALTNNVEAYDLFLRGRDLVGRRISDNLPSGMALLRQALALDPEFAEAWATLAEAEAAAPSYTGADPKASNERARQYAQTALGLAPDLALPHAVIGLTRLQQRDVLGAMAALQQALEMEPNNPQVLRWLGNLNQALAYSKEALELHRRAFELNPLSGTDAFNVAAVLFSLGELDAAEQWFQTTNDLRGEIPGEYAAELRYLAGDNEGAIAAMMTLHDEYAASPIGQDVVWSRADAEVFARGVYGDDPAAREAAEALEDLFDTRSDDLWYWQVHMHIKLGRLDRAFAILEDNPSFFGTFAADYLWLPSDALRAFRRHPKFAGLLQREGVVEAWQALGWPDRCQPDAGTDGRDGRFSCI